MGIKRIIVILGPNASGKSSLSIKLCLWLNQVKTKKKLKTEGAEIISADSRQVYKGLDIGSGKITKKETKGVLHHLIDVVSVKKIFTVTDYKKLALKKIEELHKKNKLPVIVGGTGFYIQVITDKIIIPEVKPDWKLRKSLERESPKELYSQLLKLDKKRAKSIDKDNPRRLIRAIEIVLKTGSPIPPIKSSASFDVLKIGIKKPKEELKRLIEKRLKKRLKEGMIKEVENLHKSKVSWKRLEELGLEYRYIALYLQKKISYNEMVKKLQKEIEKYAKRQMTWFKKDKKIIWIENLKEIKRILNHLF